MLIKNISNNGFNISFYKDEASFACIASQDNSSLSIKMNVSEECSSESSISIEYVEKLHAINKIPGGFGKRESRNKDSEIFSSRLIIESIRGSIDKSFRRNISVNITIAKYEKGIPIESLAINALSSLIRYAGIPSTLIAAESISYIKDDKNWKSPANDMSFLLVTGSYQGITYFYYMGQELPGNIISKGISEAFQKIFNKLEHIRNILPNLTCNWLPSTMENQSLSGDPIKIAEAYVTNNYVEIKNMKESFIANWQDKAIARVRWTAAVQQILKAYLVWREKRLTNRLLHESAPISINLTQLKHNSGLSVFKEDSVSLCYSTVSNANENQIVDSYTAESTRRFVCHVDKMGHDNAKGEVFDAILIRSILKNYIIDDRFIRITVEALMMSHPIIGAAVTGAWLAMKIAGVRLASPVSASSLGIIFHNYAARFIVDITNKEAKYLTDATCYFGGSKSGFSMFTMTTCSGILVPLAVIDEALTYATQTMSKITDEVLNLANGGLSLKKDNETDSEQAKKRQKRHYSLVLNSKNPKLKEVSENLAALEAKISCGIKVADRAIILEAEYPETFVDKLINELYAPNEPDAQMFYAKVTQIDEKYVHFKLLGDGKTGKIKRENVKKDVSEKSQLVVKYKGRVWSFFDLL